MLLIELQAAAGTAPTPSTHFYSDWTFWQWTVALLALVLSQLPPLSTLFRSRRLTVDIPKWIKITHKAGNPNVFVYMNVVNRGGREARVSNIAIAIRRDGGTPIVMSGQSFTETQVSKDQLILVPFVLRPGSEWGHVVLFYPPMPRQEEREFRKLLSAMSAQINERLADRKREGSLSTVPVTVDEGVSQPFVDRFNQKFIWLPGEYEMTLTVDAEPKAAAFTRTFRFTLFETDTSDLKRHLDDYPIGGGGLTFHSANTLDVSVPISEIEGR